MTRRTPTRADVAGQTYLALRKKARTVQRATDELIQLHALEAFIERLTTAAYSSKLILKGGALLAAFDVRRPTRIVDLSAQDLDNAPIHIRDVVQVIAAQERNDGWHFESVSTEPIREDEHYSGVRVNVQGQLATARVTFHVDVSVGDVVWPGATSVLVPRLLGGSIAVRAYPLSMVLAEKSVTAMQRRTANTRWRDFADIYLLTGKHSVSGDEVGQAVRRVADHRSAKLVPLSTALAGFEPLAAARWSAWVRKQSLTDRLPKDFAPVLRAVVDFADPLLSEGLPGTWNPTARAWSKPS